MPISTTSRKTTPFAGNGSLTALPFAFKVFSAADVGVIRTVTATGIATELSLGSQFSVDLNADQDVAPGGTVRLLAALPVGTTAIVYSNIPQTQPTNLTNAGGFYPRVIVAALDRAIALIQQLGERAQRTPALPVNEHVVWPQIPSAQARANTVLGFDATGAPALINVNGAVVPPVDPGLPPQPPLPPPSPLTLTPQPVSAILPTSFTLSMVVSGTIPAGAVMRLEWSDNPTGGPWRPSLAVPAVPGPHSRSFTGTPSSARLYWRGVVSTLIGAAAETIHATTPTGSFDTPASGSPLTLTLGTPTNVTATSFTLPVTVGGTIPNNSVTLIQWTDNPNQGPWRESPRVPSTVGVFSHAFTGAPPSTTITWRAFVFTEPATIHAQTTSATFNTSAGSGTGGSEPPTVLSAARVNELMLVEYTPTTHPNLGARGYGAHQYGATIAVGAALKHNRINASWAGGYCPVQFGWRDRLARIYIDWLTVAHQFAPPSNHNQAVEWVCVGAWARIRPSLNNGLKQWVRVSNPTGAFAVGLISSGQSVGGGLEGRNGNRICRLHTQYVLHPWAIVNPRSAETNNEVDSDIFSLAAINPADPFSESRFDDIVSSWWIRAVPWNEALPLGDITANPILAVASADPYVNRAMAGGGTIGVDCASGIAASPFIVVTTNWQQLSYRCSLDAPDKHTTFTDVGTTNAEFLTALPPGYA